MGVEEEKKLAHDLVDKVFDDSEESIQRSAYVSELHVRMRNFLIGNVIPSMEIKGDPKKGVVTPLE